MNSGLEIYEYHDEGFQVLMSYGSWRIAALNFTPDATVDHSDHMERHLKTDEVFLLLKGNAYLILGGCGDEIGGLEIIRMEPYKLYNVKQYHWHHTIMDEGCAILLVEEKNTFPQNTPYCPLSPAMIQQIKQTAVF